MTTIAAVQGSGWAVVGFDSRATTEDGRVYTMSKSAGKLAKNGEYLLGAAGDLRAINILTYVFKPPAVPRANTNLNKFMTSVFIPALRTCFEENGLGKEGVQNSVIIVAVRGKVYEIGEQYEWCEDVRGIYAIGSGGAYALGSLYSTIEKDVDVESAKKFVKSAVEIAASLDPGTGSPVTVLVQKA